MFVLQVLLPENIKDRFINQREKKVNKKYLQDKYL